MKLNLERLFVIVGIIILTASSCCPIFQCLSKKDYSPQNIEDFRFDIPGYTKTFKLNLKYYDLYSFGIANGDIGFPAQYKFTGKLRLQFFYKNKPVGEEVVEKQEVAVPMPEKGMWAYNKEIDLYFFKVPFDHKYKNNLFLKVTVIKPDFNIYQFGQKVKIIVDLSGYE